MRKIHAYVPSAILIVGCLLLLRAHGQARMAPAAPLNSVMPEVPGYTRIDQTIGAELWLNSNSPNSTPVRLNPRSSAAPGPPGSPTNALLTVPPIER